MISFLRPRGGLKLPSRPILWAAAPAATLLALLLLRAALPERETELSAFLLFAVALTFVLAGRLPDLVVVLLWAAFASYLFIAPHDAASMVGPSHTLTFLYLAAASAVALLYGSFRQALLDTQRALAEQSKAEEAARENELRFRTMIDMIPQLAWVAGADGYVAWYNRRWYEYTGTTPEQMEGWGWQSVHDPAVLPKVLERWTQSMAHGAAFEMEFPIRGADGRFRRFFTRALPLKDADGRIVQWFGTNTDINEINDTEVRRERDFSSAVVDTAGALVVVLDRQRRITLFNNACQAITGYSADEVYGRHLDFLIPPEQLPGVLETWDALLQGRIANTYENCWVAKDGSRHLIAWSNTVIVRPNGEVEHVISTGVDNTERNRAEAALRASEERFRALVSASSEILFRMSPDWKELRQLHSAGFLTQTALPSRTWLQQYVPLEEHPRMLAAIEEAIRTTGIYELEHRILRADGSVGWAFGRAVPLTDANGEIVEWFGAASDITARKAMEVSLRESEDRFRTMADSSPVIMWVADRDDGIQFINRTFREFFGVTLEQVQAARWLSFIHPDDAASYSDGVLASLREKRAFVGETRVRRADGDWRWMQTQAEPRFSPEGEFLGHVGASFDVTERRQAELALHEADKSKTTFLAMLSHELRNPLAPIRNSLYIVEHAAPGSEQARRAHQIIDRQTAHMTRLIDDLLDVTRISHGKINLQRERLELCDLVRRTVEDHRSLFVQNDLALDVELPKDSLWVNGDKTRLVQVIGNLLQNAVKFTGKGGKTSVTVTTEGSDGFALVRVRDTGLGMSPGMLPHLFEPFAQADSTLARNKGGLGLGLALVKGLVELHGGTVTAHSEGPGTGSEFTLRLPIEAAGARAEPTEAVARRRSSAARRVLVIEDNTDAAESLKEALELGGHEVVIACDGAEGIAKARQFKPDAVLCDIGLPTIDGYEVARALRADPALDGMFLVALTGYAAPEDQQLAAAAGFDRHLAKPPNMERLQEMLAADGWLSRSANAMTEA